MATETQTQTELLPFHRPLIDEEEIQAVVEVLRNGWLTTGPKVHEFEQEFARVVGSQYALAVSSCTAGLHLALEAIGIKPGDEVLLPALTFTATAEAVAYLGAKPVLVDCEPEHFNMDVQELRRRVTYRTRAIMPVHFAGHPCGMSEIMEFARSRNISIIEDAAHAFPAQYKGRNIGTLGELTAFSFYATKTLTTGEGGMVTTDDQRLAERIRLMSLHGMNKDAWKRYAANGSWRYEVVEAGFKYNLTDIQAALGLVQLSKSSGMRERRAQISRRYTELLCDIPCYQVPVSNGDVLHAWHLYVLLIERNRLRIDRDELFDQLRMRGIGCAIHFIPLHFHPYYQRKWGYQIGQFPVTEHYFERCISLPIYPGMTNEDVDRVVGALVDIYKTFRR